MSVATTILSQIGGRRFIAFTGSTNFMETADKKGLIMKLRRNNVNANYLEIKLNGNDLYDMKFIYAGKEFKVKAEYNDVYCDMLEEIFTSATGLYTKF
jgi:hypothetical protein